ncbi:kelch-like protein 4 [Paramacrobiotus metropolitanus]|uniref:kelch-like protein 4 n=1 Tax=Paramacrobiotus metropolitanus TaxID=2943436 RepID=UPI0024456AEB|nr:kelch-like protein 4 [Paramacrobiotus metropolitanus]
MLYCFADSDAHKNPELAARAKSFVLKHFMGISQEPEFLQLPKDSVIDLIRCDDLYVPHEDDVLATVVRWLHHDFEQRRGEFWEMLQHIRQLYLSPQCSDQYLLACINAFMDYSGAENDPRPSEHLQALPGYTNEASSARYTARKSCGFEDIIICAGGLGDVEARSALYGTECFHLRTSKWGRIPKLPYSVASAGLAFINNDLFLCGGYIGRENGTVTSRTLRYNSALAGWIDVAPMQTVHDDLGIAAIGDHLYVVSGHDTAWDTLAAVERYDVATNQWTYAASLPTPLENSAVLSFDGQLLTFGGCASDGALIYDLAYCYDPVADVWKELPRMPTARYYASACLGSDGWIYVIGALIPVI